MKGPLYLGRISSFVAICCSQVLYAEVRREKDCATNPTEQRSQFILLTSCESGWRPEKLLRALDALSPIALFRVRRSTCP